MWTLSIIFGLLFILAGQPKLFGVSGVLEMFENWGYPARFAHVVGLLEISGGIGLMIPRVSRHAAKLLLVVMLGAFVTHIFASEWMRLINVAVFAGAVYTVMVLRNRQVPRAVEDAESNDAAAIAV